MVEPASTSHNKENSILEIRDQIDNWRGQRFEKLTSRLMRSRQSIDASSCFISPSILGMKCPKNVQARTQPPASKVLNKRSVLSDVNLNSSDLKTGIRRSSVMKKSNEPQVVRQTITSKLRMIQSNPLMEGGKYHESNTQIFNESKRSEKVGLVVNQAPIFSTPAVGKIEQLDFSNCISAIKPSKSPSPDTHARTCLKY